MGTHLLSMESLEMNLTLLRMVESVDHIQHRRLARTIWPDDRRDLLFFHRKTNILECFHPPEGEADLVHFQKGVSRGSSGMDVIRGQGRVHETCFCVF